MDGEDPIFQFFPGEESVDLYAVLSLTADAKLEEIKKSYRRHALIHHPDKHVASSKSAKADASTKFQQIGFAYAVLSDQERRSRYDSTGRTDEGFEMSAGEDGWEAYFEDIFDSVTRGKLDEMKKEYQGSSEEVDDLKTAYEQTKGSIGDIMTHIPHSSHVDEARFIVILNDLVSEGTLPSMPAWESSIKDEKSKLVRQKQGEKEEKEAEKLAKELGVWDEFYGSGKASAKKGKGKTKKEANADVEEDDTTALQALILKKRKNMDGFLDSLASKYTGPQLKGKGKGTKRSKGDDIYEEGPSKKKSKRAPPPPEIEDEEFERLQQKLFGDQAKPKQAGKKVK